jgi:hypothetical protein
MLRAKFSKRGKRPFSTHCLTKIPELNKAKIGKLYYVIDVASSVNVIANDLRDKSRPLKLLTTTVLPFLIFLKHTQPTPTGWSTSTYYTPVNVVSVKDVPFHQYSNSHGGVIKKPKFWTGKGHFQLKHFAACLGTGVMH